MTYYIREWTSDLLPHQKGNIVAAFDNKADVEAYLKEDNGARNLYWERGE